MRRAVLVVSIMVRLLAQSAEAGTLTLAWDPNTEADLDGYFLSYGTASGQYTTTIDVGNVTSYQFTEPNPSLRYYLALRAYNAEGTTSTYSNEIVTTPAPPLRITGLSSNRVSPQPAGTSIVFTAIASGGIAPYQFKWWIDNGGTSTVGQQWSTSNMFTWTPSTPSSTYVIRVWARNAASTADAPDNPTAILTMTFSITGTVANVAPTVNAGADRTITLPATAALTGTVSDDGKPTPPGIVTLSWTRVSGPGTVTFSAPTAASTTATFSTSGTYVLRLTASDSALSTSDNVTVVVNPPAGGTGSGLTGQYFNDPSTGQFTTLIVTRLDSTVNFTWSAAPVSGVQSDNFSVRWTGEVLAPTTGTYRFATTSDDGVRLWVNNQLVIDNWTDHGPTINTSPAITLTAGVRYAIRLEFYERGVGALIQLRWTPPGQAESVIPSAQLIPSASANLAPTVNAGADRTITLPATAALTGTVSDDGKPTPPGIVTLSWTRVSGPGTVTFSAPTAASTTATFSTSGTYVLRLTASDSALSTTDDVTVTVNPAVVANVAPTVNAGADRTITLPATAALTGTVSDDGKPTPPGIVTLSWTRVSGPGTVTFSAPTAASTTATFSTSGTYVLRLTASDSALSTSDNVTVVVNPPAGGTGSGLTGQYFNDPSTGQFTTLIVTRLDSTVNFTWSAAPVSGVQSDNFSVRWTGEVLAPTTGTYRFATTSDDGVRLWVNNQLVIDNWTDHAPAINTSPAITLTAGVRYTIRLEFYERGVGALIQLRWTPPSQPESVIPSTQLFP